MMDDEALLQKIQVLARGLHDRGLRLATAESCTGGWIAKQCTDLAGSSDWFECGFVTYSNRSKQDMLEVSAETLALHGAVSEAVAAEMVRGAVANSAAEVAVAVTGIAGPGGATDTKPVGMVCLGWLVPEFPRQTETVYLAGDRNDVRRQTVAHALDGLLRLLG